MRRRARLAERDLRSREGEAGKTALQREGRAGHGPARMGDSMAEERFFPGSERSAEPRGALRRIVQTESSRHWMPKQLAKPLAAKQSNCLPAVRRPAEVHLDGIAPRRMLWMAAPYCQRHEFGALEDVRGRLRTRIRHDHLRANRLVSAAGIVEPRPLNPVLAGWRGRPRTDGCVFERVLSASLRELT